VRTNDGISKSVLVSRNTEVHLACQLGDTIRVNRTLLIIFVEGGNPFSVYCHAAGEHQPLDWSSQAAIDDISSRQQIVAVVSLAVEGTEALHCMGCHVVDEVKPTVALKEILKLRAARNPKREVVAIHSSGNILRIAKGEVINPANSVTPI
jgi:hypothetical protein